MNVRIVHKSYPSESDRGGLLYPHVAVEQSSFDLLCAYFEATDFGALRVYAKNNHLAYASPPGEWVSVYRID